MKMKKKLLLLSSVGIAAGLLYALESSWRKRAAAGGESSGDSDSAENLGASTASRAIENDSATRQGASMARVENGKAEVPEGEDHQLDDHGTNQAGASHILKEIRDTAFDADNEKLALALGRPAEEIEEWTSGNGLIDGDVVMKARALAMQRGVEVE
jgi:hypothetical protein